MAEFDAGFKIVARLAGQGLSRMAGIKCQHWDPIGDTLQTTERLADRAFRAEHEGRRFVVYFEAYTRWVESAVWSVLAKSALLSERERLPTRCIIFVLLPQGYRSQGGTFRLETGEGEPTQQVWFQEICLWEQEPQKWWAHYPGLLALTPLCRQEAELPTVIARAAAGIRKREMDSIRRADLLTTLGIFGKLKDRTLDVLSILRREEMSISSLFPELFDEGQQIRARKDVLQVLRLRFGDEAASEFEQAVNGLSNLEQLELLHEVAIKSRRLSQFRKAFPKA